MMIRLLIAVVLGAAIAGCSSNFRGSHSLTSEFDPKEAMYIFTVGRGAITGRAFVRIAGKTHSAAKSVVTLVPATKYARERIAAIYGGRRGASRAVKFPNADPRYTYFTRKTTADRRGNFKFLDIADGVYFVTTTVVWGGRKARALIRRVTVKDGLSVKLLLFEKFS